MEAEEVHYGFRPLEFALSDIKGKLWPGSSTRYRIGMHSLTSGLYLVRTQLEFRYRKRLRQNKILSPLGKSAQGSIYLTEDVNHTDLPAGWL